jgi:mono/diheme cytochrome c family protein
VGAPSATMPFFLLRPPSARYDTLSVAFGMRDSVTIVTALVNQATCNVNVVRRGWRALQALATEVRQMRNTLLAASVLWTVLSLGSMVPLALSAPPVDEIPPNYIPSGAAMYKQYCGACHGSGGKGDGPAAFTLKTQPADLTTLTVRHMGQFPREYVVNILRFGPGTSAHGSSEMPTWGSIFQMIDKNNERVVQQRIKNITDYIASLQKK